MDKALAEQVWRIEFGFPESGRHGSPAYNPNNQKVKAGAPWSQQANQTSQIGEPWVQLEDLNE